MLERISAGVSLARSSWRTLMSDKKLLLFPCISGILTLLVIASFFVPLGFLFKQGHLFDVDGKLRVWVYPIAFSAYFGAWFVIIFCNAALMSCVLLRFDGQPASLGDGFRAAMLRRRQILGWAVVSACIGLLMMIIESHKRGGQLIARILGTAWSVMTFFTVPILVVQNVGPFAAIRGSVSLIRRTWGEALVGKIGLGIVSLVLFLPVGGLFLAGYLMLAHDHRIAYALFAAGGLSLLAFAAVTSALRTVFMTALYQYAAFQRTPDGFDTETLARAFHHK